MKHAIYATATALALLSLLPGCDDTTKPDPTDDPILKLYASVGGIEALQSFETLTYDAVGSQSVHSEATQPGVLLQVNTFDKHFSYDRPSRRSRSEENRDTAFPFPLPRTFTRLLHGETGWTDGLEGVPVFLPGGDIDPDKAAGHAWMQQLLIPQILLRRVQQGELSAAYLGLETFAGTPHHKYRLGEGADAVEAFVDDASGHLDALRLTVHDTLLCDQTVEIHFDNWTPSGGYDFPNHAELRGFGGALHIEDRSEVVFNDSLTEALFAVPAEATLPSDDTLAHTGKLRFPYYHFTSAMGVPFSLNQHEIQPIPLAAGVTLLLATHNSLVIEQTSRVVVIEAPLDEGRSEAMLDWIKTSYPGKEISHVITTHHHLDHSGGLRRFVAEGSVVVAAQQGAAFLDDDVFAAACTVFPDALSQSPSTATIESVTAGGSFTLDDPQVPIVAYQIDSDHAADMLIIHLPQQNLVFNSDLYNPLPPELQGLVTPFFRDTDMLDFLAGLQQHGIQPTVVVGGHGGVASAEQFAADIGLLGDR